MNRLLGRYITELINDKAKRRKLASLIFVLSIVVVLGVVWGLHGIGISMTDDAECGIMEHEHTDDCYQLSLICGMNDGDFDSSITTSDGEPVIHAHDAGCYEKHLICTTPVHYHTVACLGVNDENAKADGEAIDKANNDLSNNENNKNEVENNNDNNSNNNIDKNIENNTQDNDIDNNIEGNTSDDISTDGLSSEEGEYLDNTEEMEITLDDIDAVLDNAPGIDVFTKDDKESLDKATANGDMTPGRIYVLTASGVRDKDYVHEYLKDCYYPYQPTGTGDNVRPELFVFDSKGNAQYVKNAAEFRYITDVDDYFILCAVRANANDKFSLSSGPKEQRPYWEISATTTYTTLSGELIDIAVINVKKGTKTEGLATAGEGMEAFYGGTSAADRDVFYGHVRESSENRLFTHSDIEITDGAYFEIKTTRQFNDGSTYQVVTTKYKSYVSAVHSSEIYEKKDEETGESNLLRVFREEDNDYEKKKAEGETQFEFTSQYMCREKKEKHFPEYLVDNTTFYVDLRLVPQTSDIVTYNGDPENNQIISQDKKTYSEAEIEELTQTVENFRFDLNRRYVVDAKNKCPDHTGLDFNVLSADRSINVVPPAYAQFKLTKEFTGGDISSQSFEFELFDADDPEDVKSIIVKNTDANGNITFTPEDFEGQNALPNGKNPLMYPIPGSYHYKLREVVPDGAVKLDEDIYEYDGVRYDARTIDIEAEVEVRPTVKELLVMEIADVANADTKLYTVVTFSYNGRVLQQYEYNAGEYVSINDEIIETFRNGSSVGFENSVNPDRETSLEVYKVWDDGRDVTDNWARPRQIVLDLYRKQNDGDWELYYYKGNTSYVLSSDNNWHYTFDNLPEIVGDDKFTYKVEEHTIQEYSASYDYSEDGKTCVITNRLKNKAEVNIEKKWQDVFGNPVNPGTNEITGTLYRMYKPEMVSICVHVYEEGARDKTDTLHYYSTYRTEANGEMIIELKDPNTGDYGKLDIVETNGLDCTYLGKGQYLIKNVQWQWADVFLEYKKPTVYMWNTGDTGDLANTFAKWSASGTNALNSSVRDDPMYWPTKNNAYSTNHTASTTGGVGSLNVINRQVADAGVQIPLNTANAGNNYRCSRIYSVTAYVKPANTFTGVKENSNGSYVKDDSTQVALDSVEVPVNLRVGDDRGHQTVVTGDPVNVTSKSGWDNSRNFTKISNPSFKIPDNFNSDGLWLRIDTIGEVAKKDGSQVSGKYSDLFIDDVILAEGGAIVDIDADGNMSVTRQYDINVIDVSCSPLTWKIDTEFSKPFTLNAANDWKMHWGYSVENPENISELEQINGRTYQYYVVENPVPEGYRVTYRNDYVGTNTQDTPIEIINIEANYELPNTGGVGSNKIRWLGIIIMALSMLAIITNNRRKHRRSG